MESGPRRMYGKLEPPYPSSQRPRIADWRPVYPIARASSHCYARACQLEFRRHLQEGDERGSSMRDGFKIWDTDTHTRPSLETLEPFYGPSLRERLPELEQYKRVQTRDTEGMVPGRHTYAFPDDTSFNRTLG